MWVETGELELPVDPLVLVETGELPAAEVEVPLVDVVTGAAVEAELAVPLVAVVIGAAVAAGVAAGVLVPALGVAVAAAAERTLGFVGLCRTLWIVRRTTWVRTRGWSARVADGFCEPLELSA